MELVSSPRTRSPEQLDWERKRVQSAWKVRTSGIVGGLVLAGLVALVYTSGKDGELPASKEEFSLGLTASHRGNGMKLAFGKGVQQLASTMLADPEQSSSGSNSSSSGNTTSQVGKPCSIVQVSVSHTRERKHRPCLHPLLSVNVRGSCFVLKE